jgi:hypothetical protein
VGQPKQALEDFFSILSTWSIKGREPKFVLESLRRIKAEEKKDIRILDKVCFSLSKDDDLQINISAEPSWEEVRDIFKIYLTCLDINPDKMLHIADYLGRNDLGTMLCELDDEKQQATAKPKKQDTAGNKPDKKSRKPKSQAKASKKPARPKKNTLKKGKKGKSQAGKNKGKAKKKK